MTRLLVPLSWFCAGFGVLALALAVLLRAIAPRRFGGRVR